MPPPPADSSRTLIGVGDVHARCTASHPSAQTAALIAKAPEDALVFSNGDHAGVDGSAAEFQCFDWEAVGPVQEQDAHVHRER